jgi:hypothetical protein
MKISNGCWIQKEGITAFFPQEVYFCDVKKKYNMVVPGDIRSYSLAMFDSL